MHFVTPGTRRAMRRSLDPNHPRTGGGSGVPTVPAEVGATVRHPFTVGLVGALGVLAAVVIGAALASLSTVLLYVGAGLFIALGIDPAVAWLQRRGLARPWAICAVLLGLGLVVAGILAMVVPLAIQEFTQLINAAPHYLTDVGHQPWFTRLNARFGGAIDIGAVTTWVQDFAANPNHWLAFTGGLLNVGVGVASGLTGAFIVVILSLYFLASLPTMKQALYSLVPRRSRPRFVELSEQITLSVGGYVQGMVVLAALNASLGFIAMLVFHVPYAGILVVVVFVLALIPLIGSVTATILVTLIGLLNSPLTAAEIGIYYLVYMQIEAYVLTPRIMNRAVSVPGSLVVIGALAGGTLLGLFGALIAIPVTASIILIVKQVVIPRQDRLVDRE